eukprot:GEMP01013203.1.p1 GENE.GEMP01013203.1~~GEMP01013203.1.p1  ORF type:complete len:591 (+),score=130.50 GEMP01013203.1:56-1774(+)
MDRLDFPLDIKYSNLPDHLAKKSFFVGGGRFSIAAKCAEWVGMLESLGVLDPVWRQETPARSKLPVGASDAFKKAEDCGDRLMRAFVRDFFDSACSQETSEVLSAKELKELLSEPPHYAASRIPVTFRPVAGGHSQFPTHDLDGVQNANLGIQTCRIKGRDLASVLSNTPGPTADVEFEPPNVLYHSHGAAKFIQVVRGEETASFPKGRYELLTLHCVTGGPYKKFSSTVVEQDHPDATWIMRAQNCAYGILDGDARQRLLAYEGNERFHVVSWCPRLYLYLRRKFTGKSGKKWLKRALEWLHGSLRDSLCEASNWSVALNFCADLIGLEDVHLSSKDGWRDEWGAIFPPRLSVSYGRGNAFKNTWCKREANVIEALVGQLHFSNDERCNEVATLVSFLCVLCAIFPPLEVPPSNEKMMAHWQDAERRRPMGTIEMSDVADLIDSHELHLWLLRITPTLHTLSPPESRAEIASTGSERTQMTSSTQSTPRPPDRPGLPHVPLAAQMEAPPVSCARAALSISDGDDGDDDFADHYCRACEKWTDARHFTLAGHREKVARFELYCRQRNIRTDA